MELHGHRKLLLSSFYRRPNVNTSQLDALLSALETVVSNYKGSHQPLILGGDLNLPDICWDKNYVKGASQRKPIHEFFLSVVHAFSLTQLVTDCNREDNTLDLVLTNSPSQVKSTQVIPGLSGHEAAVCDCSFAPRCTKKAPRTVHIFSKVDWESLHTDVRNFSEEYDQSYHAKSTGTHKDTTWKRYKSCKASINQGMRQAKDNFLTNIINSAFIDKDIKPFWKFVRTKPFNNTGISPLKEGGRLFSDSQSKADILNRQFTSVFSVEDTTTIPTNPGDVFPSIPHIVVDICGVHKLLSNIKPNNASGLDFISCRLLKEAAFQLAPVLTEIFQLFSCHFHATQRLEDCKYCTCL